MVSTDKEFQMVENITPPADLMALSEKATPGPWKLWGTPDPNQVVSSPNGFVVSTLGGNDVSNAEFIVALVNDFRARPSLSAQAVGEIRCYVATSKESCDAGPKYWVTIERDGKTITPYHTFIRGRAEYEIAHWDHVLSGAPKPDILAYDTDEPTPPQPADAHPDDIAVDRFAVAMKEKLASARAKGYHGWDDTSDPDMHEHLSTLLREHVEKGDPRDVANFAMFLHQRGESIAAQPADGGDRVGELVEAGGAFAAHYRNMIADQFGEDPDQDEPDTEYNLFRAALAKFQPAGGENDGR
jgi:hypothetical protein